MFYEDVSFSKLNAEKLRSLKRMCGKTMYKCVKIMKFRKECQADVILKSKIKKGRFDGFSVLSFKHFIKRKKGTTAVNILIYLQKSENCYEN